MSLREIFQKTGIQKTVSLNEANFKKRKPVANSIARPTKIEHQKSDSSNISASDFGPGSNGNKLMCGC